MATIRDYTVTQHSSTMVYVSATDKTKVAYTSVPSIEEINTAMGASYEWIRFDDAFRNATNMTIAPSIYMEEWMTGDNLFKGCTSLVYPPVIGRNATHIDEAFNGCTSLIAPPSIPNGCMGASGMFEGCTSLSGYMVIRSLSLSCTDMFKDTTEPIYIYTDSLDSTSISNIEASANNGNVEVIGMPDAITPVTDRGEGSRTTYTDMNRMVNNAVLAVSTYCPARMVYTADDIVHQDEWLALVTAAQTIDNTITTSTHYTNLNKIEKAFESAL